MPASRESSQSPRSELLTDTPQSSALPSSLASSPSGPSPSASSPPPSPPSPTSPLAHSDLLRRILTFADTRTLCACLRVNYDFLDLAVAILYRSIDSTLLGGRRPNIIDVVRGAAVGTKHLWVRAGGPTNNFKTQLLKYVRTLDASLGENHDPVALDDVRAGCSQLVSLQTMRFGHDDFGTGSDPAAGCVGDCLLKTIHPNNIGIHDVTMYTELDPYLPIMENAARVTMVFTELVEVDYGYISYTTQGLGPLNKICRHLRRLENGAHSKTRTLRILLAGIHTPDRYGSDTSGTRRISFDEDDMWMIVLYHLHDFLVMGVELYLCSDPDTRSLIREYEPKDGRYGLEIDALNDRLRVHFEKNNAPIPPVLVQSRADYLRLTDITDEMGEARVIQMRKDEAAYQQRKAEDAAKVVQSD